LLAPCPVLGGDVLQVGADRADDGRTIGEDLVVLDFEACTAWNRHLYCPPVPGPPWWRIA
jgi:hypothetical protein